MAEHLRAPLHPENQTEIHRSKERREHLENLENLGRSQEHDLRASAEHVRAAIDQHAVSGAESSNTEREQTVGNQHQHTADRTIRDMTYKRALVRLQKRQPTGDRILSKIIHHGAVDAASDAIGKTVARPSGLIGGGLAALIGTSILLFTARYYGFRFNYLVFFACFTFGLLAGQLVEAAIRLNIRRRG